MQHAFKKIAVGGDGAVWRIHLDDPASGNLVDEQMLDELLEALDLSHANPAVRAIVFSAAGDDFCHGGSRDELLRPSEGADRAFAQRRINDKARRLCDAIASHHAVTIAQVQGRAQGAGFAVALHCDLRVGTPDTVLRMPELTFGVPAAWGGALARLIAEVGASRLREMLLTGRALDAATAERLAVLHRVVPMDELDDVVDRWVRPIVRRPPHALYTTKAILSAYSGTSRLADVSMLDASLLVASLSDDE